MFILSTVLKILLGEVSKQHLRITSTIHTVIRTWQE